MRTGIFGGTFNPIHYGHLRAAEEIREHASLDTVLFIPSGHPPLKTENIVSPRHRYRMTQLAVKQNSSFKVLDIECKGHGKSYTVNTLEKLLMTYRRSRLYFILGIDTFLDIPQWWKPEKLVSLVNFIVISRPRNAFADLLVSPYLSLKKGPLRKLDRGELTFYKTVLKTRNELMLFSVTPLDISATEIRERIQREQSIKYLLPAQVESYIISNNLYKKSR